MPRLSFALENLKNIQEMIRFADTKAGAILVVYGFLITLYVEIGKGLSFGLNEGPVAGTTIFILGLMAGSIILHEVVSIVLNVVRPKLATGYNSEERCLYYFDHIARCSKVELIESINNIDEGNMVSEIATQIQENSKILTGKLVAIKSASNRLVASGLLVVAYGIAAKLLEVVKW